MLNSLNQLSGQIDLKNSFWMFNSDFDTYYEDRYDFIHFSNDDQIEYLDGKGELIRKDTLVVDLNGNYEIKGNPYFKRIETLSSNEMNFIFEVEFIENDSSKRLQEIIFNFTKLTNTKVNITNEELEVISKNSEWEIMNTDNFDKKIMFVEWKNMSEEKINEIVLDKERSMKYESTDHLVKISNTYVYVQQRLNTPNAKAIVTDMTHNKIILCENNKQWSLKRIK